MTTTPDPTVYGPMVSAADVEDGVQAALQRWITSYLYAVERTHDLHVGSLPVPRSYVRSAAVEKFPEDQLPCVMIASPGLTDRPTADGLGYYTARWRMLIAVEVVARGNRLALTLARHYATAIRALVVQQPVMTDLDVQRIEWMGERYDVLDSVDDRTVCIAQVEFGVQVAHTLDRNTGPLVTEPPTQPPPTSPVWPTAETVGVTVIKEDP